MFGSLGINYTVRDPIYGVNYCATGAELQRASYSVNDVSATSVIISPS